MHRSNLSRLSLIAALALAGWASLAALDAAPAAACPMCAGNLSNDAPAASPAGEVTLGNSAMNPTPTGDLAEGFAWSILLMIGIPYAMFAGAGVAGYVAYRRNQARREAATAAVDAVEPA